MFRPTHVRRYVSLMQARGFNADAVLRDSGLDSVALDDANCLISVEQSQTIVSNMIRLTGDSSLGFAFGMEARITDIGIVGHAFMSVRTMRQVVSLWIQYGNSLVGSLLQLQLEEYEDGEWGLLVTGAGARGSGYAFCVEDFFVSGTRWGSLLAGEPFRISRLQMSYPRPVHAQLYEDFFHCPVEFDAAATRIRFAFPPLDHPQRADNDTLNDICVRHCQQVMRQIASQSPLISRIRSLFLQKTDTLPDMSRAARELGVSVRTLRRRLLDEGTSYQKLMDRFRHDLAIEYLSTGLMTPKEVAYLLGFKFPNTFQRAFRSWTGQTVGEYTGRTRKRRAA